MQRDQAPTAARGDRVLAVLAPPISGLLGSPEMDEPSLMIGREGTVTVAIRGGNRPGEVLVPTNGGTETYLAYSDEPIPSGAQIVVYDVRGGRRLGVMPLTPPEDAGGE